MELNITIGTSTLSSAIWNPYGEPYLVQTLVYQDRIELVYRQDSNVSYGFPSQPPPPRITKRVYKVELLEEKEGFYESPQGERYIFPE